MAKSIAHASVVGEPIPAPAFSFQVMNCFSPSRCSVLLLCGILSVLSPAAIAQTSRNQSEAKPLDELAAGGPLWEMSQDAFEAKYKPLGLQWLSQAKDEARFFGNYNLWNGEIPVTETLVEFQNGKVFRISFSIFNRGDNSDRFASRKDFEKKVDDDRDIITKHLAVQPKDRGRDATSAVKAYGLLWTKLPEMYLLEWSYQKENPAMRQEFRPEFIRLRLAQMPKPASLLSGDTATGNQPVLKASLTANVTHEENGDVVIKNVPMVDQGPKGYCAVATAERVFKYYGVPVDQNEMAQVANTKEGGGTSPTEMFKALTVLEARLHVKVRAITKWDFAEFSRMIDSYNREAKHDKKKEVSLARHGNTIDIGEIYSEFDPDALKTALTVKNKANFSKFQRTVEGMIDRGVPLMWGVELGLYKETKTPQVMGGHMRLIIGYNTKTNELLYSDSWGEAHALKRMPIDNAFAMTTGLYYMEPLK